MKIIELSLKGNIPSKKNSKQIINVRGRHMIISSSDYLKWEKHAVIDLIWQAKQSGLKESFISCSMIIGICYPDKKRRDLSNTLEGIMDALVKAKIIKDDCWKVVQSINVYVDKLDCPGVRIEIREMKGLQNA